MAFGARPETTWKDCAPAVLVLLAPALGGTTELWAIATLMALTGCLFLLNPPTRRLGIEFDAIFLAIAAGALIAFLPASLSASPSWRIAITNLGITLPGTRSPQPWLSLEAAMLMWLGLAWAYYLFACSWSAQQRETIWDLFCFGILGLTATLTICFAFQIRIPFWPVVREFGFFPNRNQTSNVLGLGGIMIYANAFHHLQAGRRRGWMWLASLGLVCWALILNYSRAGIVLFFAGALIWHLWWLSRARERGSSKAVAWAPLAILILLLVTAGGETLVRFQHTPELLSGADNGRALIQRDAVTLLKTAPVLGIGLGNFRSLFTAHRHFFVSAAEAIHPESDWLWMAIELGCLTTVFVLIGILLWMRSTFPFVRGSWRDMRVAAVVCCFGFVIHGIFDVSGHRVGSLWPALFLAGVAINPESPRRTSRAISSVFRFLGVAFIGVAAWWGASIAGLNVPATSVTLDRLTTQAEASVTKEDYEDALRAASDGLKVAPLRWIFYYNRGLAEAALGYPQSDAVRDFAVARYLLPNWPQLYLNEGATWLANDEPERAFEIWKEGMSRLDNGPALYQDVYGAIKDDPELRERWKQLGSGCKPCQMTYLENAEPVEFQIELSDRLRDDPELTQFNADELKRIFEMWYRSGDKLALAQALQEHANWRAIGWRELAKALADYNDYQQACQTASKFVPEPDVPVVSPETSIESLSLRFQTNGNSQRDGLILASEEARRGNIDSALATLEILGAGPKPAATVFLMQSRLWAQKANWQKAWEAMARYLAAAR